jgi:anti-sigma28 factor (negative regulator of flagellin synthesis)
MKINGRPYELPRPIGPAANPTGGTGRKETQPDAAGASSSRPSRTDSVEISSAGRALAGVDPTAESSSSLTPERLAELRQRVLEGAYNSVDLADQVARRILDRGDA